MDSPAIWIELTDSIIDQDALRDKLADPDVGAHGWFVGVTRRMTQQRVTEKLSFQAHAPMARRQLEQLASEAIGKFSLAHVVIVHRLGEVPVGQASVVVGCSSGHRESTFQALPWIMDRLKRDVPIWKQETYVDGSTEWVHPDGGSNASGEVQE